jgi:polar amino acid transport system substrate-binding protein
VAINLKNKNIKIKQLSDLHQFSIIAFQSASKVLGKEFFDAVNSNLLYIDPKSLELQLGGNRR